MSDYIKLEIFIPESHFPQLQKALQDVDAGHIGNYDSCLSYSPVIGTWRPLKGTRPFIGEEGKVSCEPELKVERRGIMIIRKADHSDFRYVEIWMWNVKV